MPVRRVASFEELVKNLGDKRGFIDLFWKGVLLVEQKSIGRDLKKAKTQALDYFPGLKNAELPRYVLLSDFQTFELYDLESNPNETSNLAERVQYQEILEALKFKLRSFQERTNDPWLIKWEHE